MILPDGYLISLDSYEYLYSLIIIYVYILDIKLWINFKIILSQYENQQKIIYQKYYTWVWSCCGGTASNCMFEKYGSE